MRASSRNAREQRGEEEVAEVIGRRAGLEPVGGTTSGRRHHAGVVDEQIDVRPSVEDHGRAGDTVERREIERHEFPVRSYRLIAAAPAAGSRTVIATCAPRERERSRARARPTLP